MPTSVKTIAPVRTTITICLMIPFAIHVLEDVRTRLTNFGSHMVEFFIFSATPCLLSVIFGRMGSIAFSTPGDMKAITKYQMTLFPTIFTLRNFWVCVCTLNSSNVLSYIESMINDVLC